MANYSGNFRARTINRALQRHHSESPPKGIQGDCWIWDGPLIRGKEYGKSPTGSTAHRFIYEHLRGEIPDGFVLDHLCRNRRCVNPDHMEIVTARENVSARGEGLASANLLKTHCDNGHEFDESNTYTRRNGSRACRACCANRMAVRRARERI